MDTTKRSSADDNEVRLSGTVSAPGTERELPSGTLIVTFRVTLRRKNTPMTRASRQGVDVVDCTAWSASARKVAMGLEVGDRVELTGALRRRFYRQPQGAASRVEVEVQRVRRARSLVA